MTSDQAKFVVIQTCYSSPFLKGILFGKGAWSTGFPDAKKDQNEMAALVKFFKDLATALEQQDEKL